MKRYTLLAAVALTLAMGSVSCDPHPVTTSAVPTPASVISTASPSPAPTATATPPPTETLSPTTTPCSSPTPGGPVRQIVFSADEWRGSESHGGSITPIYLINSDGSGMRQIYQGRGSISDFRLSPEGTRLAFSDSYYVDIDGQRYLTGTVYVLDLASGNAWPVLLDETSQRAWRARWVSNDRLVYVAQAAGPVDSPGNIYLTDASERWSRQLTDRPSGARVGPIAVSPDGAQLLFVESLPDSDVKTVYRMDLDETGLAELMTMTYSSGLHTVSVGWSPSGDQIAVAAGPIGSDHGPVYVAGSDGTEAREIATLPGLSRLLAWTETGLVFHVRSGPLEVNQIVEVQTDGTVRTLVAIEMPEVSTGALCSFGELSPDRQRFACAPFFSEDAEGIGLYVMNVPGGCSHQILSGYRVQSILWLPEDVLPEPEHP